MIDSGFLFVLLMGMVAMIAIGAVACAFLLMWCAMLLSKIERNQRVIRP